MNPLLFPPACDFPYQVLGPAAIQKAKTPSKFVDKMNLPREWTSFIIGMIRPDTPVATIFSILE
jgi:hypothetical protein